MSDAMLTAMGRSEKAAEAARLYAGGLTQRQVAEWMGISRSYAGALITDPDGLQQRRRRDSYQGVCERCGGVTRSDGTSRPSPICADCSHQISRENARWSRATIVAAIRRFAADHGRPPLSTEWKVGGGDGYPATSTVLKVFGSWAEAITAAGYSRPRADQKVARERRFHCLSCGTEVVKVTGLLSVRLCGGCNQERVKAKRRAYDQREDVKAKRRAYREELDRIRAAQPEAVAASGGAE